MRDLYLRGQRRLSLRGTVIVWDGHGTITDSHRADYANANHSLRLCVLYDRVYVYYIIEKFKLFRSISLKVRNFIEFLKPINFYIIKI